LLLTLNRPEVRNAYDARMRDELVVMLQMAEADPTITSITLTGAGPSFCSGGDLSEFGSVPDPVSAHVIRTTRSAGPWLARCKSRTTAVVHGACVGAGTELPAFVAQVVARPDATFQLPEVPMGLIPGAGGTVSLPRRIGRQRTAFMAITGSTIDAETALAWHLVDQIEPAP
jgi:enoyl-CoA hydratase/carnithine racemase